MPAMLTVGPADSPVVCSTLTESIHFADIHGVKVEPHFTIFNSLLILLEILHIYWTYLILKVCCAVALHKHV
jgi:hypothetical protein